MGALSFSEIEVFMSFFDTFAQMSVLFMMVIVGFCCNKLHYMDQDFNRKLSSLILNVTAPFLILSSVMGSTLPAKEDILPVLIAGLSSMVFVMIVAVPITMLLRIKKEEAGIYRFMLIFGNINFIGFPVVGVMFGPEAIFYASVLTIPFYFFIFLLGVILVTAGRGKATFSWRMFFSPCLVATYISIILVLLEIKAPATVSEACHLYRWSHHFRLLTYYRFYLSRTAGITYVRYPEALFNHPYQALRLTCGHLRYFPHHAFREEIR